MNYCLWRICFVPLDPNTPKFFGFSEFLAGLALMVLAWTIADIRYRFRISTATVPLAPITFFVVAALGVLTLLTDLWRAEAWLVPQQSILTPASWQALLGSLFLLTFLGWAWFAFIQPPIYGRMNAKRYANALYAEILKGSTSDLATIAEEFARSAGAVVRHATDQHAIPKIQEQQVGSGSPKVEQYANDILLLIADKRFCRTVVESSPITALVVFEEIERLKKYGVGDQVTTFARNIVSEALRNTDSFLFHETEGYETGLLGYRKPLSQAMFSNHTLVESVRTLLEPDFREMRQWRSEQWEAYCRVVLMTFASYVGAGRTDHTSVLYSALGKIEHSVTDLYKINGLADGAYGSEVIAILGVVIEFIKDSVTILEQKGAPDRRRLRRREYDKPPPDLYDDLAKLIFEIIYHATNVQSSVDLCWFVQNNSVWTLFNSYELKGPAGKTIKFKARRLIYDRIAEMKDHPNFTGAKTLAFCLNVMGLKVREADYHRDSRALHKAILSWTKKNYAALHGHNPRVGQACLVEGMSYDPKTLRIVKTYPTEGLRTEQLDIYFSVDPPAEGG